MWQSRVENTLFRVYENRVEYKNCPQVLPVSPLITSKIYYSILYDVINQIILINIPKIRSFSNKSIVPSSKNRNSFYQKPLY